MSKIEPKTIRFIKLGAGGFWEKDCIETSNTIRLGYEAGSEIHQECLNDQWDNCHAYWGKHSGTATNHVRQIKDFYQLDENTLWITFYGRKLYWAFCSSEVIEENELVKSVTEIDDEYFKRMEVFRDPSDFIKEYDNIWTDVKAD